MGFLSKPKEKDLRRPPDYPIQLCIVLGSPFKIDPRKVMSGFRKRWNVKIAFEENEKWSMPEQNKRVYLLTNGRTSIMVSYLEEPVAKEMMELFATGMGVTEDEKKFLFRSVAHILLDAPDLDDNPLERAILTVQTLLYLLDVSRALGYSSRSAEFYRTVRVSDKYMQFSEIGAFELMLVLLNAHSLRDLRWIHFHGMDQFGLPDIEVVYGEDEDHEYYQQLLGNTALYSIMNGPVLKIGDTVDMMRDGNTHRIEESRKDSDHPYGTFGAIRLVKV